MSEENVDVVAEVPAQPNQVFVGGLTAETTIEDLNGLFASLNVTPETASFFQDPRGRSKGCALAVFADADGANAAIEVVNGATLNDKEIFARVDRGPRKPQRRERVNEDQSYVYVGNLSLEVKAEDLTALFSTYGTVVQCNVNRKRRTETSVGWASVQFSSDQEAEAAQGLNGSDFQGLPLTVEPLKRPPRSKKTRAPREKKAAAPKEEEPAPEPVNEAVLYVGNLAWTTEEADLADLFSAHGDVVKSEIARDKRSDKSRGWGTVEFANAEQAAAAIAALNGHNLQEREIDVQIRQGRKRSKKKPAPEKEAGEERGRSRRRRQPRKKETEGEDGEAPEGGSRRRRRRRPQGEEGEERAPRERKEPEMIVVGNPECHLFVGNLAWDVKNEDLSELFSKYGSVTNAVVTMNRKADRSRGWGTVEMGSAAEATAALEGLNDSEYMERTLLVRSDKRVTNEK